MSLNHAVMLGTVANDPEFRVTANGVPTLTFRLSVNRPPRQDGQPSYPDVFRVVVWRMAAEKAREQVRKGDVVVAEGRLRAVKLERDGQRKNYVELEASRLEPVRGAGVGAPAPASLGGGEEDPFGDFPMDDDYDAPPPPPVAHAAPRRAAPAAAPPPPELDDDDIPF